MSEGSSRRRFLKGVATVLAAGTAAALPKATQRPASSDQAPPPGKPKNATVESRVKRIIVEHLGVDEAKVVPKARLAEDLGADSLDVVALMMACEAGFNIEIGYDEEQKLRTVEDLIQCVQRHLKPGKDASNRPSKPYC